LETILQQNYFLFENNLYQPEKGMSMGSPISNIIVEIFLQLIENTHLKQLLEIKSISSIQGGAWGGIVVKELRY
jgi:hypothetical protein